MKVLLLLSSFASLCLVLTIGHAQTPASTVAKALKPEPYLLLVEPKAMRTTLSRPLGSALRTVFTPAKEVSQEAKVEIETYSEEAFEKLGISWESFVARARATADRLLTRHQPELIKDAQGKILYGVYRGPEPVYASLMVAPSLAKVFAKVFGEEIWVAAPDRHALYVFPANHEAVNAFAADLEERFESNGFAASEEVFSINQAGELKAVASFTRR